jgi:signal transduction histidine kinase
VEVVNYTLQGTRVLMNRHLFQWVIENLCKNAVDAMNGAGKIEIKLKVTANHKKTIIDVTDTGKGIPKSKFKKIFAPGYTTKKRGWGLGLTLAKRIVENYHKGRIFVKASEIDKGTKFRIILPNQQTEGVELYELVNKKNPLRKVLESLEKGNSLSEKD